MRLLSFTGAWHLDRTIEDVRAGRTGAPHRRRRASSPPRTASPTPRRARSPSPAARRCAPPAATSGATAGQGPSTSGSRTAASSTASTPRTRRRPPAHDCPPDTYRVRYDFRAWPRWQAEWRVTGPRKDYGIVSRFRPAEARHETRAPRCSRSSPRAVRRPRSRTRRSDGLYRAMRACLGEAPGPDCTLVDRAQGFVVIKDDDPAKPLAWLIVPDVEVTGIEDSPRAGAAGGRVLAPRLAGRARAPGGAAGTDRAGDQLEGRPVAGPPPHPHLLRRARRRAGARRRRHRPRLGAGALPHPRRRRLQRPQGGLARPQPLPAPAGASGRPRGTWPPSRWRWSAPPAAASTS